MEKYYYEFIERNYNLIKKSFKEYAGKNFSEDVFQQTILNCDKHFTEENITSDKEITNYLFISFKNNLIRNSLYAVNRCTESIEMHNTQFGEFKKTKSIDSLYIDNKIDSKLIWNEIEKRFDKDTINLFYRWVVDKESIRELEEQSGIKGLNYKLNKIKKFSSSLLE